MNVLGNGAYSIADEINIEAEGASPFVFGRGWLLEIIEVTSGEYYFVSGDKEIRPANSRFAVFYPPFTIVRAYVKYMKARLAGIGSIYPIEGMPSTPIIFETSANSPSTEINEVPPILREAREIQSIEFNPRSSLLSRNAKRLIDDNFTSFPSIARIATALGVSHSHLSRQFRRDYEMSPSSYLNHLRVAHATFLLSIGEPIVDASLDAGYNDLSRFYKQFRKTTKVSPGVCRKMLDPDAAKSKNAKT
jgi:AraC-like DNA-binding protein